MINVAKEMLRVADLCGQTLMNLLNNVLELSKLEVILKGLCNPLGSESSDRKAGSRCTDSGGRCSRDGQY